MGISADIKEALGSNELEPSRGSTPNSTLRWSYQADFGSLTLNYGKKHSNKMRNLDE